MVSEYLTDSIGVSFKGITGRLDRNSIYRTEGSPEAFDYDNLIKAYDSLGHTKKYVALLVL